MRDLIIIIVVFFTMTGLMVINFTHVNSVSDELTSIAESLNFSDADGCTEKIALIEKIWKENEAVFSLTVNFKETDHLGETILALKAANNSRSPEEFERSRELLIDAIDGVCRLERFSARNIF